MSLREAIERRKAYWSARKPPPRTASITIVLEEPLILTLEVSPTKWGAIRGLFAGKSDSEIVDMHVDELLERFGVKVE